MKIHDFPPGPNPFRIRVVIAEKGLASQIEFVKVDLPEAEHKQPAFLAMNPTTRPRRSVVDRSWNEFMAMAA
jgi:glutathione S-transferase